MELILSAPKVKLFLTQMNSLETKFRGYFTGELCDHVELTLVNKKPFLKVADSLPEFIRVACFMAFVDTLL